MHVPQLQRTLPSTLHFDRVTSICTTGTALDINELALGQPGLCAVVGSRAAGCNDLLQIATGRQRPTLGHVTLDGQRLTALPASVLRQRLAYGAAQVAPPRDATVRDFIEDGARGPRHRFAFTLSDKQQVARAMEAFGCRPFADAPFSSLGANMRQRARLARVFAQGAALSVMESPVSGLPNAAKGALLQLTRRVVIEEQRACLMSTSNVVLACEYADRILLMRDGLITFDGTPAALMKRSALLRRHNTALAKDAA
ncbi:MAG: ABC transporter ATP-binding protein [Pseudomonadota bacterium]